MKELKYSDPRFYNKLRKFVIERNSSPEVSKVVSEILATVEKEGDRAVLRYTEQFDGHKFRAADLRVSPEELAEAAAALTPRHRRAFKEAIGNVKSFHRNGIPQNWTVTNPHGATVGERWYPVRRVGIYVPAGSVPLVSTIVMTTTLAKIAGVSEIAVFTPAGKDGRISPQMMAGLHLCGIDEVYRIGGAQAVGAMAFGTRTIPAVDKIMGPGNAYVAEAQRQVFGRVGIDLIPGPSEALAIADKTANVEWLAADLIAQAEHGSGREKVYYVFSDAGQMLEVRNAIKRQMEVLKHRDAIAHVMKTSTLFIEVPDLDQAVEVTNFIAPEHLELHVAKRTIPKLLKQITTAGAILCGHETPTVLGDFTAGPSHVLPTGRTGRFSSGLKITDFLRRSSVVQYDRSSLEKAREVVAVFSEMEDLDAHGASLEIRFGE